MGFEKAHDSHSWWIYDARVTSPRTCPVCLALDGTHYRGDELDLAFPYHIHLRVNAIKALVHPHCRCILRWSGRSRDVLATPIGMRKKPVKPQLPAKQRLTPKQHIRWWQITRHARECYRRRLN